MRLLHQNVPTDPTRSRSTTDITVTVTTANGIFAGEGLDRGTAVLLREVPPPTGRPRILDLGCGWGPIALGLALACPGARIDAVDVNDRALALCRDNAARLGVADRFRAVRPDEVDTEAAYDEIWSNPPIRVGKDALHELLLTWLPRLRPEGRAGSGWSPLRPGPAGRASGARLRAYTPLSALSPVRSTDAP